MLDLPFFTPLFYGWDPQEPSTLGRSHRTVSRSDEKWHIRLLKNIKSRGRTCAVSNKLLLFRSPKSAHTEAAVEKAFTRLVYKTHILVEALWLCVAGGMSLLNLALTFYLFLSKPFQLSFLGAPALSIVFAGTGYLLVRLIKHNVKQMKETETA